ncbi:type VII secretion-associated protein [Mycolicibacterium sphagni]|uniref:Type VII secretion-associated protein n=1 Tax=Mycolicibacterium sphagni TaxID=1786 RepID=A0A255DI89_9MYCO|nr:type VII secretion-associated protein [Mycolicibacterium sphagni]OYN79189.1 type VII secretion-associated protein [Mycolicibacterium sphagni]
MSGVSAAVLEIGPSLVCLRPHQQTAAEVREVVAAALTGIDDTTVLCGERPAAVAELWRRILLATAGPRCESLTLVYPSWWAQQRVARVVDAAAIVTADVRTLPRSVAIAGNDLDVVIEIADDVVSITTPGRTPMVLARPDDPDDVAVAVEINSGARVLIDAPPGVAGGADFGRAVRESLRKRGTPAQLAVIGDLPPPAAVVELAQVAAHRPRRLWAPVAAAASGVLALCAIGVNSAQSPLPSPSVDAVTVAEGRISVRIPTQWSITRLTAGPGSRRIQADSPTEPGVALHVTQSYSPGETLDHTAEMLRQAVDEQPRGVFVDFNPADRRGTRAAVTYREIRVGRDIRWAVVLDGSTRISVGCQSAPGRANLVVQPCEQAIASARELVGTNRDP